MTHTASQLVKLPLVNKNQGIEILNIRNMWLTLLPNWLNCPWLLTLKAPKFLSSVITVGRLRKTSLRLILLENDGSQNLSHYRHILIRNPNLNSRNILGLMSLRSHSNSMSLFSAITGWPLSSLVTPSLVIPSKPFCTPFGTFSHIDPNPFC